MWGGPGPQRLWPGVGVGGWGPGEIHSQGLGLSAETSAPKNRKPERPNILMKHQNQSPEIPTQYYIVNVV